MRSRKWLVCVLCLALVFSTLMVQPALADDSSVSGETSQESTDETGTSSDSVSEESTQITEDSTAATDEAGTEESSSQTAEEESTSETSDAGTQSGSEETSQETIETEETDTLFSNDNMVLFQAASASLSTLSTGVSEHGLRSSISFQKYEISYNKYPTNTVEYIVVHDTGNTSAGADAYAHYLYFSGGDRGASAHYFVDSTSVVQIIDDSEGSWHCGVHYKTYATPISNTNSIGIEMCINSDGDYNEAMQNTIDLCAYLLWEYDLDIDHLVRHYDANGKVCPLTMSENNWEIWNEFKAAVQAKLATYGPHNSGSDLDVTDHPNWYNNAILGESSMDAETMANALLSRNDSLTYEYALSVAQTYLDMGEIYGIRGDIAFFQAMLETGFLKSWGNPSDTYHNFCGLKNADGTDYQQFASNAEGIEAHIQHLYAYASTDPIPEGRTLLDPRFSLIERGCRTSWEGLGGRWAVPGYDPSAFSSLDEARTAHQSYGDIIVGLYAAYGGVDVRTSVQPRSGTTSNYWDDPIYTGTAAGTREKLALGSTGQSVKELQGYLKTLGYEVTVDGNFDSATDSAIRDLQQQCGLTVDGYVGEDTWAAVINCYIAKVTGNSIILTPRGTLDPSSSDSESSDTSSSDTSSSDTGSSSDTSADTGSSSGSSSSSSNSDSSASSDSSGSTDSSSNSGSSSAAISVSGRSTVQYGSSGADVTALQQILNQIGYSVVVDGDFGWQTYNAVVKFQASEGDLLEDGIVGSVTWSRLGKKIGSSGSSSSSTGTTSGSSSSSTQGSSNSSGSSSSQSSGSSVSVSSRSTVKYGSSGADVTALQQILNQIGYSVVVDGDFGWQTYNTVVKFQASEGDLLEDGIVGPVTWSRLGKKIGSSSSSSNSSSSSSSSSSSTSGSSSSSSSGSSSSVSNTGHATVSYGSSGSDVTALQQLLVRHGYSVVVDGDFGWQTYNAVIQFQASEGDLLEDGIVGPVTWSRL